MIRSIDLDWTTVITDSTTDVFLPASEFISAAGVDKVRGWAEVRGRFGGLIVLPAVQLANDPRAPDSNPVLVKLSGGDANGYANANGVFDPDSVLVLIATAGKKYLRVGWVVKLSSAGTGAARVRGSIQLYAP